MSDELSRKCLCCVERNVLQFLCSFLFLQGNVAKIRGGGCSRGGGGGEVERE